MTNHIEKALNSSVCITKMFWIPMQTNPSEEFEEFLIENFDEILTAMQTEYEEFLDDPLFDELDKRQEFISHLISLFSKRGHNGFIAELACPHYEPFLSSLAIVLSDLTMKIVYAESMEELTEKALAFEAEERAQAIKKGKKNG